MRILGIDPGTLNLGYGIVDEVETGITSVDFGVLALSSKIPVEQRLCSLYGRIVEIIEQYRPYEVAIEEPFVAGNARTALAIGRAQAVVILASAQNGLPIFRYLPAQVKQQVTNYGGSSKEQVKEMVKLQLGISGQIESNDAADALAIALCHINQRHLNRLTIQ
jgi:crossover junction endodeoxyribonuclease RuvC